MVEVWYNKARFTDMTVHKCSSSYQVPCTMYHVVITNIIVGSIYAFIYYTLDKQENSFGAMPHPWSHIKCIYSHIFGNTFDTKLNLLKNFEILYQLKKTVIIANLDSYAHTLTYVKHILHEEQQWINKWKWHFSFKWEAKLANLNQTPLMDLNL